MLKRVFVSICLHINFSQISNDAVLLRYNIAVTGSRAALVYVFLILAYVKYITVHCHN